MIAYNQYNITLFFVKIRKSYYKLQKFCFNTKLIFLENSVLGFLIGRIIRKKYNVDKIEDIELIENDSQLYFIDNNCAHNYKIASSDIYRFDQSNQVKGLKEFINIINRIIKH